MLFPPLCNITPGTRWRSFLLLFISVAAGYEHVPRMLAVINLTMLVGFLDFDLRMYALNAFPQTNGHGSRMIIYEF